MLHVTQAVQNNRHTRAGRMYNFESRCDLSGACVKGKAKGENWGMRLCVCACALNQKVSVNFDEA